MWIDHERKARVIYSITANLQTVIYIKLVRIYFDYNKQKDTKKSINESFGVYKDFAILNRVSEYTVTRVWTEMHIIW